MPELDYALFADYVRAEGSLAYVMAAGIDTIHAPSVPTGQNIGLLIRVGFTRQECGRPHRIEAVFQDADGERLMQLATVITPEWSEGLPVHWRQGAMVALNFGIPLPAYGLYSMEIIINDENRRTLNLRVIEGDAPEGEAADVGETDGADDAHE